MNDMTIFNFEQKQVRSLTIKGQPYFVGKDVATILGYRNTNDAILRHCRGVVKHDAPSESGIQSYSVIPESDMYRLVINSKLPEAERFERWVMEDVLPSIRKTGGYCVISTVLVDKDEYIDLLKTKIVLLSQPNQKKKKHRLSTVEKRGQQVVQCVKSLHSQGKTLDEICRALDYIASRSAIGRFIQKIEA